MSIMSLQEIMLVLSAAVVLIAYHTHLYKKVRRDPLKTAVGVTNPAGFMINTFEQNDATVSEEAVTKVLNHGALHYTIGMRGGATCRCRWPCGCSVRFGCWPAAWFWSPFYIASIVKHKDIYAQILVVVTLAFNFRINSIRRKHHGEIFQKTRRDQRPISGFSGFHR